jgi:hypothetical protein
MNSIDKLIKNTIALLLKYIDPKGYVAAQQIGSEIKSEYAGSAFINVKGIINSCTVFNHNQKADADWMDFNLQMPKSDLFSIFINTDSVTRFVNHILPSIKKSFVLVIGNSDKSFGYSSFSQSLLELLLENKYLHSIFAQNLDINHVKVLPLPIGIDYHNVWEKPAKNSLGCRITPLLHERIILKMLRESESSENRKNLLYCNWHFRIDRGDRKDCLSKINQDLCFFEQAPVNRLQNYKNQTKYRYVLSPSGLGIDCYRTWEAIVLGCIPIVKRSELFSHFEHLPLIIVNEWCEVTPEYLDQEFEKLRCQEFDYGFLFMRYWQEAIKTGQLPQNFPEFRMKLNDYHKYFSTY